MNQSILNTWTYPPAVLSSAENEVHLWRISLDLPPDELARIVELLATDEAERAARFRFKKDRDQFVARRGLLRTILRRYLDIPPEKVTFTYNTFGKPTIGNNPKGFHFNLSHSSGLALIAVTRRGEIGVDVERIRKDVEIDQVSEGLFSETERDTLRSLSPKARRQAFFNCWTRKEAYLKARGEGLSFPLNQFTVSILPGEAPRLLAAQNDAMEIERWALYQLAPAPDYIAALAVEGRGHQLSCWRGEGLSRER
jgi:4'-phosphopantetheinyl transferase